MEKMRDWRSVVQKQKRVKALLSALALALVLALLFF
jgi:hypothetical protein